MMKQIIVCLLLIWTGSVLIAQKSTYKVGILMDYNNEISDHFLGQLQNQIQLVVGEDAEILFSPSNLLSNNLSIPKAIENYELLQQKDVDLIISIGSVNYAAISQRESIDKPTILFSGLPADLLGIEQEQKSSKTPNLHFLVEKKSFKLGLQQLREVANFQRLGIVLEAAVIDTFPLQEMLDSLGINYEFISLESVLSNRANFSNVDAVYLLGGTFMSKQAVENLANLLRKEQLPSFTANAFSQVEQGIMLTHTPKEQDEIVIRRLALTVERFINGVDLAKMSIWMDYEAQLTLNYQISEAIGVPFKMSFIEKMSFVSGKNIIQNKHQKSLATIVQEALLKNVSLKAARQNLLLKNQEVKIAKSGYLPRLNAALNAVHTDADFAEFGFGQTPEFMTLGNLAMEQIIFSKKISSQVAIAETLEKASLEEFKVEEMNLISKTIQQYFTILMAKTNLEIQLRNIEVTKKNHQIAKENFATGLTGKADILRFESATAQNTQTLVEAGNRLDQELNNLNQLLNKKSNLTIDVLPLLIDDASLKSFQYKALIEWLDNPGKRAFFTNFLIEEAKKNAPELKALRLQLEATSKAIDLNDRGRFLPTVSFQGQFNAVFDRSGAGTIAFEGLELPDNYYQLGLSVTLPIFDRNQNNLRKQKNMIKRDQLLLIDEQNRTEIDNTIRNTVLDLVNRIAGLELSTSSERAANEALTMTQSAYLTGAINSVQLIDAQNNLLNAQLQKANAVYAYLLTALQIERLMGHFFFLHSEEENAALKQKITQHF